MSAVKTVTEKIGTRGDKNATLTLDDGSQVWTPSYDKALTLIGKDIPSDWTVKQGNWGPMALPPAEKKSGGGGGFGGKASWSNTEEGLRYTQERMDRRTALMQAVEVVKDVTRRGIVESLGEDVIDPFAAVGDLTRVAEAMYDWLRESSPAVTGEEAVAKKGPVGANAGVSSPSSTPTGSTTEYPADWPVETR